ncbi:MAG TPA: DUF2202 domain-containing protein [Candidatus Binatia bacterium]|nr:DUF2202 domain-containing protein [Candidatus Binatia bacterium]
MKHRVVLLTLLIAITTMGLTAQNEFGRKRKNPGGGNGDCINLQRLPYEDVSDIERQYLLTMREEEKLARDVYNFLADRWNLRVFSRIALSENKHMEAIKQLLDKYGIPDPVGEDIPGQFSRGDFQELYTELTAAGSAAIGEALKVGATIEDLDIYDLMKAIAESDSQDILTVFQNLAKGSRNHLRSFVSHLQSLQISTVAQYISQALFDSIINSDPESGCYDATGNPNTIGNWWKESN